MILEKSPTVKPLNHLFKKKIRRIVKLVISQAVRNTQIPKESGLRCIGFKFKGNKVCLEFKWFYGSNLTSEETYWNPAGYDDEYRTIYRYFNYLDPKFPTNVYFFLDENIITTY